MKFFLQILIALCCLIGLFFLLGYVLKYQAVDTEIVVNAPANICWDVYHDETKIGDWLEGIDRINLISGVKQQVGAKQEIKMKKASNTSFMGDATTLLRTVTSSRPNRSYAYDYESSMLNGSTEVNFTAQDSTTRIKSVDKFRAKKLWVRSTLYLMNKSIKTRTQAQFDNLKSIIEMEYQAQLERDSLSNTEMIKK